MTTLSFGNNFLRGRAGAFVAEYVGRMSVPGEMREH